MSDEQPAVILYDENGIQTAVTAGISMPLSTSAYIGAGVDNGGIVRYWRAGTGGELFVTGTVNVAGLSLSGSQTSNQGNAGTIGQSWFVSLTDGINVLGTGSSSPLWVTGSVSTNVVLAATQSVTGTVAVTGLTFVSGSNLSVFVTASNPISVFGTVSIGNFPTTQSITGTVGITGPVTVTGTVNIAGLSGSQTQGNSGSINQSWFVSLTDGVKVIGTSSSNPIWVTGSLTSVSVLSGAVTTNPGLNNTSTVTVVTQTTQSITIISGNLLRQGASIYNNATDDLFIKKGTFASTASFTARLTAGSYFEVFANYSGIVTGFWSTAGSGSAMITEVTP